MNILKSCPDATITVNSDQLAKAIDAEINKRCDIAVGKIAEAISFLQISMSPSIPRGGHEVINAIKLLDSINFRE
jgi:predicted ABC-type ATPase